MAAIGHAVTTETAAQSTASQTFTTVAQIAAGQVVAGATYLVLCHAHVGGNNVNRQFEFRLTHLGVEFPESMARWEPVSGTSERMHPYDYMTVWRNVPAEPIEFQIRTGDAGVTANAGG